MKKKSILITATISMLIAACTMFTGCALFSKTWKYYDAFFKKDNKAFYMYELNADEEIISETKIEASKNVLHEYVYDSEGLVERYYEILNGDIVRYTYSNSIWTVDKIGKSDLLNEYHHDLEFNDMTSFFNGIFYLGTSNSTAFKTTIMMIEKMSKKNDEGWYVGKTDSMSDHIAFKIDGKQIDFILNDSPSSTLTTKYKFIYDIDEISIPQEALSQNPFV